MEAALERLAGIHAALSEPSFVYKGQHIRVTCSFGFAQFMPGIDDINALVERADRALYTAKAQGRNRVELCAYQER
jgi:diguanylate cyclase (GGDEF)-like protein